MNINILSMIYDVMKTIYYNIILFLNDISTFKKKNYITILKLLKNNII